MAGAVAAFLAPSGAMAQCSQSYGVILSGGAPAQIIFPLGLGNSLNALLSTINSVNTAFLTNTATFASVPSGAVPDQQGGGVWARAVGGYTETKATNVSRLDTPLLGLSSGTGTCSGTIHEEYHGSQFGFDLYRANLGGGGGSINLGLTAGLFNTTSKDITGYDPSTYIVNALPVNVPVYEFPVPNFSSRSEIPFAGIYGVYTNGGFFADTQVRFDLFKSKLTDQSNGISDQKLNATGISVTANAGYRVSLGPTWFLEPSAGVVWSRVKVDDFTSPGVFVLDPTTHQPLGGPLFGAGTVKFDDIESLLGRASLRVGTTITNGNYIWQPFATASVLQEFGKDALAESLIVGGGAAGSKMLASTDRVGTYGQFGLGTALVFGNSGWLGYGRVDYKTGEKVEGINVNAGLRHQW
jgi:outer membrane autotransporter protein